MTTRTSLIAILSLGLISLSGCGQSNSSTEAETVTKAKIDPVVTPAQSSSVATQTAPAETRQVISKPAPIKSEEPTSKAPASKGLLTFESVSPIGTKSSTTVLSRRSMASGHSVATLQIDRADSAMLMDIGFNCSAQTYVYLHMDHDARPVDAAKIARVQSFSDKQLSAFSRGEALQRLNFSSLDTFPPEDIANYTRIMNIACAG